MATEFHEEGYGRYSKPKGAVDLAKANKFGAVKTKVDGITFDSKLEARFYEFVKQLKKEGKIKDFEMQSRFEIFPAYVFNDKKIRKIEYVADFIVRHHDGEFEVIDVKGVETDVFKIKRKLFEHRYKFPIKSVTYSKVDGGWVELEKVVAGRKLRKASKK